MADVFVQVDCELQKGEPVEARRTIMYKVTTSEVSNTEKVSKGGGAFGVSTAAQTVVQATDLVVKLVIPVADLDTLCELAYELVGTTDTVYVTGIKVRDFDPFTEGAATAMAIRQRAGQPR